MNSFRRLTALSPPEIEKLQRATEQILETTGINVEHAPLRDLARRAGARVDDASGRVRFPAALLRELIERAPRRVALRNLLGQEWEIGGEAQYGLAIVTDPWITDYATQRLRHPCLEDLRRHTIIAQQLEPVVTISRMDYPVTDVPGPTSSLRALETHLLHHAKHYTVLAASLESFEQWQAILRVVGRGGDPCSLYMGGIAVGSPLTLNSLNAELLWRTAREGFAVIPTICPMAGATAPYSIAGALLQANAETLAVGALAQLIRPGTPFLYTIGISVAEMRGGHDLYYTLDKVLWKLAITQLGRAYGLPTSAECGGTLTYRYDPQSGAEGMLFMLAAQGSGAHLLAGFGSNHNANGMSGEMMVIQDAWLRAARFLGRGINTDDFHLAVANIQAAGPGGNFLTDDVTLELLRQGEFFQDDIFDFGGGYGETPSLLERAHARIEAWVADYRSPVPPDVAEGLRRYFHDECRRLG